MKSIIQFNRLRFEENLKLIYGAKHQYQHNQVTMSCGYSNS